MTVPTKEDLAKRKKKLDQFMKKLNPDGSTPEKVAITAVRGAIRQSWKKADAKLAFLYLNTIPDMNPETRTKWLFECAICKGRFKLEEIEVDHINGNHTFTKKEDFQDYLENILLAGFDDMQILCKSRCHPTKTLSEKLNISFDAAVIEKQVIELCKKPAATVVAWLKNAGVKPAANAAMRRNQVREVLSK